MRGTLLRDVSENPMSEQVHTVRLEPVGIEMEVEGRRDCSRRRLPPGHRARTWLQGGPVLELQVASSPKAIDDIELLKYSTFALARGRSRYRPCPALPHACVRGHHCRIAELRRGSAVALDRGEGFHRQGGQGRAADARHPHARDRDREADEVLVRPVCRLEDRRNAARRAPIRWQTVPTSRTRSASSSRNIRTAPSRPSSTAA